MSNRELCSYTFYAFSYGSSSSRLTCWPEGNPPCQCVVTSDQDSFVGLQCTESGSVSSHTRGMSHMCIMHSLRCCMWLHGLYICYIAYFVKHAEFLYINFHVGITISSISERYHLHLLHEFGAGVCRHFMITHMRFCSTSMQAISLPLPINRKSPTHVYQHCHPLRMHSFCGYNRLYWETWWRWGWLWFHQITSFESYVL